MRRTRLPAALLLAFVAFVLAACGGAAGGDVGETSGSSGIAGTVFLGPQCPVEQAGSPCPDVPVEAEIVVSTADGSREVTRARTNAEGTFRISLDPGEYQVQPFPLEDDGIVFGKPQTVTVSEGEFAGVNLALDTGIR